MQSQDMQFLPSNPLPAKPNRSEVPDSDMYLGARETYKHDAIISQYDSASVQTPQDPRMYPGVRKNSPNKKKPVLPQALLNDRN